MCVLREPVCDGKTEMYVVTDACVACSRMESHPTGHDASTVPRKRAACWSGWSSKRHNVGCAKSEISMYVILTVEMGKDVRVRSD